MQIETQSAALAKGVRVLLVDNHSSFTYNLYQYIAEVTEVLPVVVQNHKAQPSLAEFDCVILSPGPGHPARPEDMGMSTQLLQHCALPILGICLGHQGLGVVHGARVERSHEPWHGRKCTVMHSGHPLFRHIPAPFEAVRYHSLELQNPLPPSLQCIAQTSDGTIMAIAHKSKPHWGVQFHPESIESQFGHQLLANFCASASSETFVKRQAPISPPVVSQVSPPKQRWRRRVQTIAARLSPSQLFCELFGDAPCAYWLDSQSTEGVSYMGDSRGPWSYQLRFEQATGTLVRTTKAGESQSHHPCFFDCLSEELQGQGVTGDSLPYSFVGGVVGYLGYELGRKTLHTPSYPDAQWLWADRYLAYDHREGRIAMVSLCPEGEEDLSEQWFAQVEQAMQTLGSGQAGQSAHYTPSESFRDDQHAYLESIEACKEEIRAGESYELCLTTEAVVDVELDPLDLFLEMRATNPAPYSAYLRYHKLAIASSSPERCIQIRKDGRVECKPIKGTARRDSDPAIDSQLAKSLQESVKERAENLMIVDLVRNDIGRNCEIGSVIVERFAALESYSSVHQLVSTIAGTLRADISPLHCVRDCFPAGSMTGAPKERSMKILEGIEKQPRGIYSGSIGYFGVDGAVDLSVVIRTVVVENQKCSIGVGGAITVLSDPLAEWDEVGVKAQAGLQAIAESSSRASALCPNDS